MKSHFLAWNWKTGFSIGVLEQRSKDYRLQTDGKDSQLFLAWNWKTGFSIEALAPNTKDSLNPARAIKQGLQTTDRRQGFSALLCSVLAAQPAKQKEKRVQEILLSFSLDSVWKSVNLRTPKWEQCSAVKFEKSSKSKKIIDKSQIHIPKDNFELRNHWVLWISKRNSSQKWSNENEINISKSTIELNCVWSFTKWLFIQKEQKISKFRAILGGANDFFCDNNSPLFLIWPLLIP